MASHTEGNSSVIDPGTSLITGMVLRLTKTNKSES